MMPTFGMLTKKIGIIFQQQQELEGEVNCDASIQLYNHRKKFRVAWYWNLRDEIRFPSTYRNINTVYLLKYIEF